MSFALHSPRPGRHAFPTFVSYRSGLRVGGRELSCTARTLSIKRAHFTVTTFASMCTQVHLVWSSRAARERAPLLRVVSLPRSAVCAFHMCHAWLRFSETYFRTKTKRNNSPLFDRLCCSASDDIVTTPPLWPRQLGMRTELAYYYYRAPVSASASWSCSNPPTSIPELAPASGSDPR